VPKKGRKVARNNRPGKGEGGKREKKEEIQWAMTEARDSLIILKVGKAITQPAYRATKKKGKKGEQSEPGKKRKKDTSIACRPRKGGPFLLSAADEKNLLPFPRS